jgi:transcriptional regulator with PAS, ATPase and Fis domain
LLESQLFGYEKGSFTDAKSTQKGLFETAAEGTLFLDEIAEISPQTQAKLLRVLQENEFLRVGGTKAIRTKARIISATNRNMEEAIEEGSFRNDIYYRLAVIHLRIPSLRERVEDILPLAYYFLHYYSQIYDKKVEKIEPEVERLLLQHTWPGNIRELKNLIERAVIFSKTATITSDTIPEQYHDGMDVSHGDYLHELSEHKARGIILEALKRSNGIKKEAAKFLNISRKTLYNRMKKLNLE